MQKKPENINIAHVICFIYLYFAHVSDGDLSKEEMNVIFDKIQAWLDESVEGTLEVFEEACDWYHSCVIEEKIATVRFYSQNLKEMGGLSEEHIGIICRELMEIANADGNVSEEEVELATLIARDLGVEI
jgi:uncharacterized tellurite resistance protein B-like protein